MSSGSWRPARRLRALLTLGLVAALAALWLYFHLAPPGSVFRVYNTDPELAYFVDSLAPFKGHSYRGMDHPGTPLTALGTLLLAPLYAFARTTGERFVADMIRRPDTFFLIAHALLTAANIACIVALARGAVSVRRRRDAVLAVAVPASFFAFQPDWFFWPFYWSHNAIAFPAGAAVLLGVLAAARRGRPFAVKTVAALGLGVGLMAATQLFFVTWLLGLVVAATAVQRFGAARSWILHPVVVAPAAAAAGFMLGTIPAASQLQRFFSFVGRIAAHQGIYGQGPAGFTSASVWTANISYVFGVAPWLFVATAAAFALLAALFATRRPRGWREAGLWAVAAGVAVQWAVLCALFGKHPSPFYPPALAAMLPVLLAVAFSLARRRGPRARLACSVIAAAILIACSASAVLAARGHARRIAFRTAMDEEVRRYRATFAGDPAPAGGRPTLLLWGPVPADAPCYSLWAANLFLADAFRGEVTGACPSEGLAWSNSVAVPDGWSPAGPINALLVIPENGPIRFPAFAALGRPEAFGAARDPDGQRLAFYRVEVRDGRAQRAAR